MDYHDWIKRAVRFVEGFKRLPPGDVQISTHVAPCATEPELLQMESKWRLKMPSPLRRFLKQGSGHCDCHYYWDPPQQFRKTVKEILDTSSNLAGEVSFIPPDDLEYALIGCFDIGEIFGEDGFETDCEIWQNSFPFASVGNGDFLARYI